MKILMIFGILFVGLLVSCSDVDREDPAGIIGVWRESVAPSSSSTTTQGGVPGTPIVYNGQTYKTVVIGTQTWMAENLNAGTMVLDATGQVNDAVVEKFCYSDAATNCTTDGGLYTWAEAMALLSNCNSTTCAIQISSGNHQGICPTGWHIPKAAEWNTLATYLGGGSVAGKKMKLNATGFSSWDAATNNDGNASGFSAFPADHRYYNGGFYSRGSSAFFWEATENDASYAYYRVLYDVRSDLNAGYSSKNSGFSVRCLRD